MQIKICVLNFKISQQNLNMIAYFQQKKNKKNVALIHLISIKTYFIENTINFKNQSTNFKVNTIKIKIQKAKF